MLCTNVQTKYFLTSSFRIILEADSGSVVHRVALRADDLPLGEQTVAQVSNFWIH